MSDIFRVEEISSRKMFDLRDFAQKIGVVNFSDMRKQQIIFSCLKKLIEMEQNVLAHGTLEVLPDGFGFMRFSSESYLPSSSDIYISNDFIAKYKLKTGDDLTVEVGSPKDEEKFIAAKTILSVNFQQPNEIKFRVPFDNLTTLYPEEKINMDLDGNDQDYSTRIIDVIAPIGKGQRALIVAPPRTGKTMLMKSIAHAITRNHPDVILIVLLIDERPEEVTDMQRSVKGDIISSTFDESPQRHIHVAEIVLERCKRLVEARKDVVVLLDSITRLARAYNTVLPNSGKVLTGGVDSNALQAPKRFFGAARNIEEGGSLTIISTALIDTGSRMDEVVFEEFKGTGNSEIILDKKISDRRVFPAIDVTKSGTRKEELLVSKDILSKMWILRKLLVAMGSVEAMEFLLPLVKKSKNSADFFDSMNK